MRSSRRFTCRRRWFVSCWCFYVSRPPPPHGCVFTHWLLVDASSTLKQGNVGAGITAVATELFPQCSEPEQLLHKEAGCREAYLTSSQQLCRRTWGSCCWRLRLSWVGWISASVGGLWHFHKKYAKNKLWVWAAREARWWIWSHVRFNFPNSS